MKIAFGCDHGGFAYKQEVLDFLKSKGHIVKDFGTFSSDSCDYPDYAIPVAEAVSLGEFDYGILICGTGIGMSIIANKVKGIRCAHVNDCFSAEMTRRHNNSNVIALGARIAQVEEIIDYIDIFLKTPFDGNRHLNRIEKISKYENK